MPIERLIYIKRIVLIILINISGLSLCAQVNLDSLYAVWQDPDQTDSIRVDAYFTYIWNGYLFSNPDTAKTLAEALHLYAQNQNSPLASSKAYNVQGAANLLQSDYPNALENYKKALAIQEEIGDKRGIASSEGNIGLIYYNQGNNPLAIEYYQKSMEIEEEIGNKQGIAISLNNIGLIYSNQNNYPRALEYYEKALATYEEIDYKRGVAGSLSNIGLIYKNQAKNALALEYYERSIAIQEEIGDLQGLASNLSNISLMYKNQSNYPRALEYYEKAMSLHEEIGGKRNIASSLSNMGTIYQKQGNFKSALEYCQKGLVLAEEIGHLENEKLACQCLYDTYKELGKGNEALMYLEKMRVVEDSLNATETAKRLEQMEFTKIMLQDSIEKVEEARLMHEVHHKEVLRKNRTRNLLAGGGMLILLFAGGLYSRLHYIRKAKSIIEKEKDRSESLLLNILPADIAAELKEKGRADARGFDLVSILFTDFIAFTEQSAKLSPADLVSEVNECFKAFDHITAKYKVEKIKTMGDAYMAAGGLPIPMEDSLKNTVLAALEMQAFISKRKADMDAAGKQAFEMRAGIHSGPVVAGIVGVRKFQYDIWGDTVNIANRMETNGAVGKVNISQTTYELLKDDPDFRFESRGEIDVKGKGKMEMWFVELVNRGIE
jgi:class 3 adenylate cyclase/Tfp pilus assembly protein PilF